jgi:hypothetical protein
MHKIIKKKYEENAINRNSRITCELPEYKTNVIREFKQSYKDMYDNKIISLDENTKKM